MTAEKTEALIIRQTDFSETSRVVVFFTRDWGKVSAIAKGGRRLKGPFDAALDLLARVRIVFLRKSSASLDILTEAQLLSRYVPRRQDVASLYGGYYVAELLNRLTGDDDPFPGLYAAAVDVLQRLSSQAGGSQSVGLDVLRFELNLLRELGHLPAFDECLSCHTPVSAQSGPMSFWVSQGGLLCAQCRRDEYARNLVHPGTVAVMRRLAERDDPLSMRLTVSPQQQRELRYLVTAIISHLLGGRPKMARYLQL